MLVACPGRLLDLIDQNEVRLREVKIAVVDEADRMADMGFLPVVKKILDLTNDQRQTVFFSATLGKEVQILTDRYQSDPVLHEVGEREPDMTRMTHRFVRIDRTEKVALAAHEIRSHGQTIVFCRTRHGSDRVARQLKKYGVKTGVIHGRRTQNQRDNALKAFVDGKTQALVATDVAARGIHVDGVDCVVHFDPPEDDKAYTHRSGRTARAGASGVVVSFITNEQLKDTKKLQRQLKLGDGFEEPTKTADLNLGDPIVQHNPNTHNNKGGGKGKGKGNKNRKRKGSGNGAGRSEGKSGSGSGSGKRNGQAKKRNGQQAKSGKRNGRPNAKNGSHKGGGQKRSNSRNSSKHR